MPELENNEFNEAIKEFKDNVQGIYLGNEENFKDLFIAAQKQAEIAISLDDFKRRLSLYIIKELSIMVKKNELDHRDFFLDGLKNSEFWKPLAKLVLFKRIEELKNCKVLKKGKKYDVSGLKETFFGKYIMERLKFERRTVLMDEEYTKITNAIKKLNYEVPVVIQPTETEKFFK
jgi:hypothetical protein